ncbi:MULTISPECIES: bZIP transcription factor [Niastella]|uniref:Peptidase S74 domain-containing protein n=1 Tax=Niastella soli TaxID=2821487 RepID=A0ABS3Z1H4_9BACT|nr:bZIP transcription factor [Niastella soli]MBO9204002.1 hypothetical protein [Niastella soli]
MLKSGISTLFIMLALQSGLFAQVYVKNTGNVGIGVTQPTAKLELPNAGSASLRVGVTSNMANTHAQFINSLAVLADNNNQLSSLGAVAWNYFNNGNSPSWSGANLNYFGNGMTGNQYGLSASNLGALVFQNVQNGLIASNGANIHISPQGNLSTTFHVNGNVGIGTTNPDFKLQVNGWSEFGDSHDPTRYGTLQVTRNPDQGDEKFHISFIRGGNAVTGMGYAYNSNLFGIWASPYSGTYGDPSIGITPDGNVGIGTSSPYYKLDVLGDVRGFNFYAYYYGWADYVFNADYKLPALRDVKSYIQQHHHLPDVPSEEEVKKDGINLGDQQVILLKKIEELTLYVIEQNEKLQQLEQKVNDLQEENKKLKK